MMIVKIVKRNCCCRLKTVANSNQKAARAGFKAVIRIDLKVAAEANSQACFEATVKVNFEFAKMVDLNLKVEIKN